MRRVLAVVLLLVAVFAVGAQAEARPGGGETFSSGGDTFSSGPGSSSSDGGSEGGGEALVFLITR